MRIPFLSLTMLLAIASCNSPKAVQPDGENSVNATFGAEPANEPSNVEQAPATQDVQGNSRSAMQTTPDQILAEFGNLLHARRFQDAFKLVDGPAMGADEKAFEARFDKYKTIDAEIGTIGPTEGAAGSLYSQIQLTLSGIRDSGAPYAVTGPVTLRRVNDVPGSTAKQRAWHIVKLELTAKPKD